ARQGRPRGAGEGPQGHARGDAALVRARPRTRAPDRGRDRRQRDPGDRLMTYAQLLARLLPARRFGVLLGLDRVHGVLDRLGAPHRRLGAIVHVGGTNGKGSAGAIIAALAAAAGPRRAALSSPDP